MHQALGSAPRKVYSETRLVTGPLIVALDGAPCEHLVRTAHEIASVFDNDVRVVSVVEPRPAEIFEREPLLAPRAADDPRNAARASQIAETLRTVLGRDDGWDVDVVHGDVPRVLSAHARKLHAGLLVMGIGRHHRIDRLLANETTLQVIRQAPCAVLAVGTALEHRPRAVVIATDFSAQSALAAQAVLPLLDTGATLHFTHVWEPSGSLQPAVLEREHGYEGTLPARIDGFLAALALPAEIRTTFDVREGKAAPCILDVAKRYDADLIVAGRYGLNPLARLVVGSVTTALVRGASGAILVTPEPSTRELARMQQALNTGSGKANASQWTQQLTDFSNRNRGRRSVMEVNDPSLGAQMEETGYLFADAAYDPREACVQLMFGGLHAGTPHLTHTLRDVHGIAILADRNGRDITLGVTHGAGQTLVIFESGP